MSIKLYMVRHKPTGMWQGNHYEFVKELDFRLASTSQQAAEANIKAFARWAKDSEDAKSEKIRNAAKLWKDAEVVEFTLTESKS